MAARYLFLAWPAFWSLSAYAQPGPTELAISGEQARRDLDSIFEPGATLRQNSPYDLSAAQARLRTRSYATPIVGICRRDEVILDYDGTRTSAGIPPANPVAYGVSTEAWFRVLRDVAHDSYNGPVREGECAGLSGTGTRGWFVAPDAYAAAGGYRAFIAATRQINGAAHGIAGCRENLENQRNCRNTLRDPERIVGISPCHAPARRGCYAVGFSDENHNEVEGVTLRFHYNRRGEPRIDGVEIHWPTISI